MLRLHSKLRFDTVEVFLIVMLASLVVFVAIPVRVVAVQADEVLWLAERYGPSKNSQFYEEWVIRDFFADRRGGAFVDVGANHHQRFSNTYYLETALGWSGIAVEPLMQFEEGYRLHRPRTRFRPFFVSDRSDGQAQLFLGDEPLVASGRKDFTERWGSDVKSIQVPTITLTELLDREGVTAMDLLNMDIELAEPKALAGFDIGRFRPSLVCIEAHPETRQAILDYFHRHGYVVVGKYLRAEEHNLYFMPALSNSEGVKSSGALKTDVSER